MANSRETGFEEVVQIGNVKSASAYERVRFTWTKDRHLGQVTRTCCSFPTQVVNDKGRQHRSQSRVLHFLICIARFLGHFSGLPTNRQLGDACASRKLGFPDCRPSVVQI